jgi:hypothetical protein
MKHTPEKPDFTPAAFVDMLNRHAAEVVERSPTSALYAETVRNRAQAVQALITDQIGEVKGVVTSWMEEVQPFAETLFDLNLDGEQLGALREYTPTVFQGIYGRTRILSTDEMFGPTITLDLAAEDSIAQ